MDGLERLGSTGQELLDHRLGITGCMELGGLESSGRGFQIVSELVASPEVSKRSLPVKFFHQNPGLTASFFLTYLGFSPTGGDNTAHAFMIRVVVGGSGYSQPRR